MSKSLNQYTRYRLTQGVLLFLAIMSMIAAVRSMEILSVTCITGIMTTLSTYVWAQTKRPSGKKGLNAEELENENNE